MEKWSVILILSLITFCSFGATQKYHQPKESTLLAREFRFIELKAKKEINDKKNTPLKKYTIAVLVAREFKLLEEHQKANEFYKIALDTKVDIDKTEVKNALKKKNYSNEENLSPYFFNINLDEMIANRQYEKAILSINPFVLSHKENEKLRIIYDLLNVKFKKFNVKKLYCIDRAQSEIEGMNYEGILCDFLNDYLKDRKKDKVHLSYVEDYFLKNDLNKRYLLNIVHDL